MLVVCLFCLAVSTFAAGIPKPKLTYLATGDLEISIDGLPGLRVFDVKYSIKGIKHQGPFHHGADGRWYNRNHDIGYSGQNEVKYTIIGEIDGKTVISKGKIHPETVLAVMPPKRVRRGTVVLREDFDTAFSATKWDYEVSMYGGYNWEVQAYVPDARNIFTKNGRLFIKPTLTTDHSRYAGKSLTSGTMDMTELYGYCTNAARYGCYRAGKDGTLPPVMSGKIKSKTAIKYGSVEVRARTPRGDWIWPAIWMLPRSSSYGGWPASGEIDIMESRGNLHANGDHGVTEVGATLHWGPDAGQNRYTMTHGTRQGSWSTEMHTYRLDWTVDYIHVFVDDHNLLSVPIAQSFWNMGGFHGNNIWASGTKAAPFDTPFYLILNVAVAGTNGFFPDNWTYDTPKPWKNTSPTEPADFWNDRAQWYSTWNGDAAAMEIEYIQITQL